MINVLLQSSVWCRTVATGSTCLSQSEGLTSHNLTFKSHLSFWSNLLWQRWDSQPWWIFLPDGTHLNKWSNLSFHQPCAPAVSLVLSAESNPSFTLELFFYICASDDVLAVTCTTSGIFISLIIMFLEN